MRRPRPAVGVPVAVLVVAGMVSGWGTGEATADAESAGTLYVNHDVACSDSGAGTQDVPFCTVQAAADVVEPGQTVRIESPNNNPYSGSVTLTRSGTKDAPITFTGAPLGVGGSRAVLAWPGSAPALTLKAVHDVHVESLTVAYDDGDGVAVTASEGVTLDRLTYNRPVLSASGTGTAVTVDGTSSDVTVSRNWIADGYAYGVRVEAGAARVTATTNVVTTPRQGGIAVSGTTGADVTSNTVFTPCATGISLDGGSAGVVENNVVASAAARQSATCPAPTAPLYAVSADSAGGVTGDYNVAANGVGSSARPRAEYSWAGASYATTAALRDATGQGTHDIDGLNVLSLAAPSEHSPLIDSADADAPGELSADIQEAPRVDDRLVADTGTGTTHPDRGAFERHDIIAVPNGDYPSPATGVAPLVTSFKTGATSSWGEPLTYSFDFGDGSAPATGTPGDPVAHSYTTPGRYNARITVTDADGTSRTGYENAAVAGTAVPPTASLSGAADTTNDGQVNAGYARFTIPKPADAWEIAYRTLTYGDGSQENLAVDAQQAEHQYPAPGTYTATLTQTDLLGRTTTAKTAFHAADAFVPMTPEYDTEKTIPAHGVLKLSAATLQANSNGVDAAQLQIVTSEAKASGSLTLYTAGTTRPGTSSINFEAGRTATNEATVKVTPTGSVDLYNGSSGPVTVEVATVGLHSHAQFARTYHPATPVRLLDTRTGTGGITGPVAGGHSVTLSVAGTHGVPTGADAVVLNVAATTTKGSGHLTVSTHGISGSDVTGPYWTTGQTASDQVMVPLVDGKVVLHNTSRSSANLVADLVGWYGPTANGAEYQPVTPARILNTRTGTGSGRIAKLGAHATLKLKVTGAHGVPASGVRAVDLNLTVPTPSGSGYLVAYADGTSRPGVHSVDFTAGHTAANGALVKVGADGEIALYNAGSTSVDVYADLLGDYAVHPVG
ncbi:PKD domain-containing protein [Streptomyces yaanensis]|uniref:PKD domain-containing protein n=1 Tax=Streptomyces yaanensis TaxID=1142239 RepID=A0ABV7S8Q7_9ACTN|nr:PKD domain-containing protein [Streptomyces sp. CGMCC 4.7035]WNC02791.1 PKD domain-containing protein [Streptomyces sp. CGMCC 4.7035]